MVVTRFIADQLYEENYDGYRKKYMENWIYDPDEYIGRTTLVCIGVFRWQDGPV